MKKEVGLWIDHRQATIVILTDKKEQLKRITSGVEERAQASALQDDSHEDRRYKEDRRLHDDLSKYYQEVAAYLSDSDAVLIFGPGEAKGELQKHLEAQEQNGTIVSLETTDKMTDGQIKRKVRQHFRESPHSSNGTAQQK
ncbi:hypothetical protein BROC_02077 [Candidatus Brocadiaceae bacterium]|nr:hypothetical protein BROC_02077 [Candidatus Brocadiaceae bacterium]